ncbi:PLP dependent protein [Cytobacillus horneckiae]|uniref:Pyridoxal phosphate homeostasis protein n=1 Tax=Cytobacillus horneckiae TaxID=549687 RepID=A0A2N0ZBG5_9BACI|nr:YggS family pyridoxal phosphate-dependent enzyme [Cytobacillus horneckiae]MBN6887079.1 YggS family pyridoxal phosphate-dependent enzyme [Cytobacillus horneckiae]MCM3178331.1 YggS family pyridoxal phosphate-dependent enzyme [Cytobacillus horneckiae]MEC1156930.1 YggS family pyridoxal phosphate-dependent enzyme [Cytobacillus horneckiae]MED2940044.1 YggS family pyridoxal phosphate-dependent enzyme [Cytobacillus horneckiae]PKG26862.1 YggS family pyridoxal phosphate-dependent enzyme [Cytobacillus
MEVQENLKGINKAIIQACNRANRDPKDIKIIAVTKYVSVERAAEALEAGIVNLGENRDEGLNAKWEVLKNKPTWHFIGSLQSRKVKNMIDKVDCIHSLDRISLAKEIDKRADKNIDCLVQVNVSGEESKQGLEPEAVIDFVQAMKAFPNIRVIGLMTMAPYTQDENMLRSCFKRLKAIQEEVNELKLPFAPCTELSMGMSNDFQIAIEEGATMVRIGTALVGNELQGG